MAEQTFWQRLQSRVRLYLLGGLASWLDRTREHFDKRISETAIELNRNFSAEAQGIIGAIHGQGTKAEQLHATRIESLLGVTELASERAAARACESVENARRELEARILASEAGILSVVESKVHMLGGCLSDTAKVNMESNASILAALTTHAGQIETLRAEMRDELRKANNALFAWQAITKSPLWDAAGKAVSQVSVNRPLQEAASAESVISFCPRCGQTPDGDRRQEEARELVMATGLNPKRSDLDFAIAAHFWMRKNAI